MSNIRLWQIDEDDDEDEEVREDLYDGFEDDPDNDSLESLEDLEDVDIFCKQCDALVEDGFQCDVCGWMVEVQNAKIFCRFDCRFDNNYSSLCTSELNPCYIGACWHGCKRYSTQPPLDKISKVCYYNYKEIIK